MVFFRGAISVLFIFLLKILSCNSCGWAPGPGIPAVTQPSIVFPTQKLEITPPATGDERDDQTTISLVPPTTSSSAATMIPDPYSYIYVLADKFQERNELLIYDTYDTNKDGEVTLLEMVNTLEGLSVVSQQAFTDADKNGDAVVTCQEFLAAPFWPAQHRDEIKCTDNVQLGSFSLARLRDFIASKGFTCPTLFGSYQDTDDCSRWWVCTWGQATPRKCQRGLLFDNQLKICNYANVVKCDSK